MILYFPRKDWENCPFVKFTKEELDKAEKGNGFIGYFSGIKCYLLRVIK